MIMLMMKQLRMGHRTRVQAYSFFCPSGMMEYQSIFWGCGMAKCKYKIDSYECSWDNQDKTNDGYCILHSQNFQKDFNLFKTVLHDHRERHGDSCIGIVFPSSFLFGPVTFKEKADFSFARFSGKIDFSHATFLEDVSFSGAEFDGDVFFSEAQFRGNADFTAALFKKNANFFRAVFQGRTSFISGKWNGEIVQIFSGTTERSTIDFRDVIINPPDSLVFRDVDLRRCRFLGTDLRKVEIINADWCQIGDRHYAVYDEYLLREDKTKDWPHIESLYRQLKQNFEDRKDYDRAGEFHFGEKEMRRKNPRTSLGFWFLLCTYRLIGGYGESYIRPLLSAITVFLVSWICYIQFGLRLKSADGWRLLDWTGSVWDKLSAAHYTLRVMILLKPDDLAIPVGNSSWVFTLDSIAGPLLLGLFALAVRQRLRR